MDVEFTRELLKSAIKASIYDDKHSLSEPQCLPYLREE